MDALPLATDSDCPSSDRVHAQVRELTTPEQRRGVAADAKVMVSDRGESIAVAITRDGRTTVRIYRDPARNCARRAHFVSVLVVVSLMPPELGSDPEPPTEPLLPPAPPPPAPPVVAVSRPVRTAPSAPQRVRIELAARGDVSVPILDTVRAALPSGALGVALGAGALRLTLGTGYAPRSELRYTSVVAGSADLTRYEVALGGRLVLGHAPIDTSLDTALVLSRFEVTGSSSHRPTQDTAFSGGARVGLYFNWSEQGLVSPFVGVYATVFPFAPALSQLPQGTVGHLPYVWLGLSGGLALAL